MPINLYYPNCFFLIAAIIKFVFSLIKVLLLAVFRIGELCSSPMDFSKTFCSPVWSRIFSKKICISRTILTPINIVKRITLPLARRGPTNSKFYFSKPVANLFGVVVKNNRFLDNVAEITVSVNTANIISQRNVAPKKKRKTFY